METIHQNALVLYFLGILRPPDCDFERPFGLGYRLRLGQVPGRACEQVSFVSIRNKVPPLPHGRFACLAVCPACEDAPNAMLTVEP